MLIMTMTQEKRKALKAIAIVFGGILGVYHLSKAQKTTGSTRG
jgi:hypothetical protein